MPLNTARLVSQGNMVWCRPTIDQQRLLTRKIRIAFGDWDACVYGCVRVLCELINWNLNKNRINSYLLFGIWIWAWHGPWIWHIDISHTLTFALWIHIELLDVSTKPIGHPFPLFPLPICRSTGIDGGEELFLGYLDVVYFHRSHMYIGTICCWYLFTHIV